MVLGDFKCLSLQFKLHLFDLDDLISDQFALNVLTDLSFAARAGQESKRDFKSGPSVLEEL